MRKRQKQGQRGSTMIEFVLVSSMFLVPMLLGIFTFGFAVLRSTQVVQFTRDAGHMYSRGIDFSAQGNQNLLATQLGQGLNIVANSGNVTGGTTGYGEVVFSTFTKIAAGSCSCTNAGHIVVMKRIIVGNNQNYTSPYGSPSTITSTGDVTNYSNDVNARADNFSNLMTMTDGEIAYLAESLFKDPDLAVPGLYTGISNYQSAIF